MTSPGPTAGSGRAGGYERGYRGLSQLVRLTSPFSPAWPLLLQPIGPVRAVRAGLARLALTVIGCGRYPSQASMRISMPAVPAQRGWSRGSRCGDTLAWTIIRRGPKDQVPYVKAYDCAHFQPQGR
jgi:hypothetical protein